ncbi:MULTISPECIES: DUF7557 family protein [Natrinema]|nr:hypothetical protein [Natrinema saccharevitans]
MASTGNYADIKVDPETRDRVRALKRGGESYDELLNKMADQYDPEEADR